MGLPGHRRTSSHKHRRAAHFALEEGNINACPKCKKATVPHRACAFCGTYKGRQVLNVDKRMARATRKTKKK
jgi:large subunit ribosomal protein L32